MAYKDSDELKTNERYPLGEYSFRIERTSVPGSSNDKIEAICTDKDGKNARKSIQVPSSTDLNGWYVEANETEASVYALLSFKTELNEPVYLFPIDLDTVFSGNTGDIEYYYVSALTCSSQVYMLQIPNVQGCMVSLEPFSGQTRRHAPASWNPHIRDFSSQPITYKGETAYVSYLTISNVAWSQVPMSAEQSIGVELTGAIALLFGSENEEKEVLVARFAIDVEDAGGDGPGSDWEDPGDYDPEWEEGDPTHTLYVTVTGALSGRHNDPIVDPSYSYIPADKDTVKDYGCGGDGGHGGGGGAGASTVVVHKFATNQANSKEVTAIARRHGYGSGGGKGGKGGDGCILVYY